MAFFNSAVGVLQTLVIALGAGLAIWGVVNLMEGYGNDNPGAKSQGIKQLMAGGGVVLIRGYGPLDIIRLPVPDDFFYAVAHPDIVVGTKEAREVLPREIPMAHAVTQWGNVGGLVAGLALGDVALIGRSMHDVVAEPYRKGFIPGYDRLKEGVLSEGALAMNIAGSGPSVFALAAEGSVSERVAERMKSHFAGLGIGCNIYAGRVSNCGARIED